MDLTKDINIALLVDVDNISSKYTPNILNELSKYGKVTIRRLYGDWSQGRLRGWLNIAQKYSLTPIMQPNNTPGKNASDIGLIIDAMDILYSEQVQGFCIASSDGDFNKLATRIREAGMLVIGMGEKKTPESFRASCERFVFLDLYDQENEESAGVVADTAYEQDSGDIEDRSGIENAIVKMVADNEADGKPTGLGEIGSRLIKIYPDFDIRSYGFSKLSTFLKDLDSIEVITEGSDVWVALKSTSVKDIEGHVRAVFSDSHTNIMNVGLLKSELGKRIPNLDATIRQHGITRFSVFVDRRLSGCLKLIDDGNRAQLKE